MLKEQREGELERIADIHGVVVYAYDLAFENRTDSTAGISTVSLCNTGSIPGGVILEIPLGDAVGFWNASSHARNHRTLDPDWVGSQVTSIVNSVPLGCVYGMKGESLLGFAFDETVGEVSMKYGVSEEDKTFVVQITLPAGTEQRELAIHSAAAPLASVISNLTGWLSGRRQMVPMQVPAFASEPVYSTWYAYNQDISASILEEDLDIAEQLGLVTAIIDDGWQLHGNGRGYQGCGDWVPDTVKFPELEKVVDGIHRRDMRAVLWVAPLLLGADSAAFARLAEFAPSFKASLNCYVLDPRLPEVRAHVVALCVGLVERFGLDGLKIDFLDEAMLYASFPSKGDIGDVGQAMEMLLGELRARLEELLPDGFFIEFRHPYVSPAIAPYANVLRASDCPGDALMNRGSILDARMLAAGRVVHSDPILWDMTADPAVASRQLLSAFFGVPQISMPLSALSMQHRTMVRAFIALWKNSRHIAIQGSLSFALPVNGHPVVIARSPGLQCVVGVYAPSMVTLLDPVEQEEFLLFNATAEDSVVVDVRSASVMVVKAIDPLGRELAEERLQLDGLHRLRVPPGGVVRLVPATVPRDGERGIEGGS